MRNIIMSNVLVLLSIALFAQQPQRVTCPKCDGYGKTTYQSWENCSSCKGSGIEFYSVKTACPQCKGTKKMKSVDRQGNIIEVPCNWNYCNNGYYMDQKSRTCGSCGGKKGRNVNKETTCSRCSGKGYILKY